MPNPYHFRARINRLTTPSNAGYVRLRAVSAILRELSPANPRAAINNQMLQAVDSYDFARHQLRDLYDNASPHLNVAPAKAGAVPAQLEVAPAQAGAVPTQEESTEEDEDPL